MCGAHAMVCYELYMVYTYLHAYLTHVTSLCLIFPCMFVKCNSIIVESYALIAFNSKAFPNNIFHSNRLVI